MSVILQIEDDVINENESINFFDLTGAYDVTTNPGGWNAPNKDISKANTATLYIWLPLATTPVIINIFTSSFPTITTTQVYNITTSALGLGSSAVLPDGIYTIQYVVTGDDGDGSNPFSYNTSETFPITTQTQCCIDKMFLVLDPCGCKCGDDKLMQAFWAQSLLTQAEKNACCGQIDNFYTLLAQANKVCAGNCQDC